MIYVTGANGQLGFELQKKLSGTAIFLDRSQLNITNQGQLENFLKNTKIDLLINAAAYTQVDKAESEKEAAYAVNSAAPEMMARYSKIKNFKFIHFSTDYVFDGKNNVPYNEDDKKHPLNVYGSSKLDGEIRVLNENPNALIIRTSWVYSSHGKNFIKTVLRLASEKDHILVVNDQVGSLTWAKNLADVALLGRELKGLYHYSNEGSCSWFDVASEVKRLKGFKADIRPITSSEYPGAAVRPQYTVLDKTNIKRDLDIKIPHWQESLELFFKENPHV